MHIPLWEGDDNSCRPEQIVYAEPDGAFNHQPLHQAAYADPEVDFKNEGIISEIIEEHYKVQEC